MKVFWVEVLPSHGVGKLGKDFFVWLDLNGDLSRDFSGYSFVYLYV